MRKPKALRSLRWISLGLAVWAIAQEARKPPDEREWHGQIAGFVPYDFRFPSIDRIRQRLWDPNGALLSPQVFGVGWTVNLGRLSRVVKEQTS
jgi:hypothetical protein